MTISTGAIDIFEPAVKIEWASSDLSNFIPPSAPILDDRDTITAGTSSSAPSETSSQGASAPDAVTQSSSSASPQGEAGLSSGAKAGIGVGVAVGVLLILGLLLWILVQRKMLKRRKAANVQEPSPGMHESAGSSVLPADSYLHESAAPKYQDQPYAELSTEQERVEMSSKRPPAELYGAPPTSGRSELG